MAVEQFRGQREFASHLAHFIFVQRLERLHDAAARNQFLNAGHPVVMCFDQRRFVGAPRFDGVGIDGALPQDPMLVQQAARFDDAFLHPHELLADGVAFLFGIGDSGQGREELLLSVLHANPGHAANEIGFTLAHQAGIDVNAAHAFGTQSAGAEAERDGGIHAAAHEKEDAAIAHTLADFALDHRDAVARIPIGRAAAHSEDEVGEILLAACGMDHLWMELHSVQLAPRVGNGSDRTRFCAAGYRKTRGHRAHHVAMAHPDLLRTGKPRKHGVGSLIQFESGESIFPLDALADLASQQMRHELLAVADAENGDAEIEDGGIYGGAAGIVDAAGTARNDQALGDSEFGRRSFAGPDLGIHAQFPDLARLQMGVLSPGIEDDNLCCWVQVFRLA